jgi:uncharacterized protein (TIGR02145 family)
MKKNILLIITLVIFTIQNQAQTVTDIDGNVYTSVHIGTQIWLGQNLNVAHYNNGDSIPNITDDIVWGNLTTGAYCDYNNIPANSAIYGKLYNHYTISDPRYLCPTGWHVSSDDEWVTLVAYLGGDSIAGGKLKETGTTHWLNMNFGASNESGFTALPGGERADDGTFLNLGVAGIWWDSTSLIWPPGSMEWEVGALFRYILAQSAPNPWGFSVRCISNSSGVEKGINPNQIKIYPNPTTTTLNIVGLTITAIAEVYDISGKQLLTKQLNTNQIDISSLAKGLYFIKLSTEVGSVVRKFVKE